MLLAIQILLGVLFAGTGIGLVVDLGKNRMDELKGSTGKQWASAFTVGIIANFLDTLGCGSYAPSTFMYKLFNQIDDIDIPGTLNIGDTFPVIFEAFIFTTSVECDPLFLWVMFICAAVGSFGFASIVTKWPRNKIRIALGCAMLPLAVVMLCKNLGVGPFGLVGTAVGLTGWKLIVAAALNVLWGALMDIGFGLYAPCMATCLLLGVDAQTCFPVFMGSCACLMPACSIEFIKSHRYDVAHTIGNAIGGCIGVFIAAVTLITSGKDALDLLKKVDYKTLLFFVGLFVVVGGLEQTGILTILAGFIGKVSGGNLMVMIAIIIWVSAIASAFIDNIPFAATMIPVIDSLAAAQGVDISILAWALAMGTDIGGSATPIGASANVVGIATAAKSGHMIKWGKYCKAMAPATILVVLVSMLMIYARYL